MREFEGKVLVVTGGAKGIGKAIALEAAKRKMKLVVNDILEEDLEKTVGEIRNLGVEVYGHPKDISTLENIEDLFNFTMEKFGQVDLLVNNAGVCVSAPLWEAPIQDINWAVEINLLSRLYASRIFLPQMIKQKTDCAIVNVASTAGLMVSGNAPMYHTTKSADLAQSEATYIGLLDRGIDNVQIHCLCPAFVKTEIHKSDPDYRPERYRDMSDPYYETEEFKSARRRGEVSVLGGMDIDYVGLCVFNAIEEGNFYVFTHPESSFVAGMRVKRILDGQNPA